MIHRLRLYFSGSNLNYKYLKTATHKAIKQNI